MRRALGRARRGNTNNEHWVAPCHVGNCSPRAKKLARDGVTQAVAMLKNVDKTLPLSAATAKTVALIGPNAKLSRQTNFYAVGTATVCPYAVV